MRQLILSTLFLFVATQARSDEAEQVERLRQSVAKEIAAQHETINQEYLKLQNALDSANPEERARAAWSICASRDIRLIPVIRELLASPNPSIRQEAIHALSRLKAKNVGAEVGKLVSDPDSRVRHAAAEYGTRLGYNSTLKEVNEFLRESDFTSQSIAMHLSQSLPPDEAVLVLAPFLHHQEYHLRKRAIWALMKYDVKLIRPYALEILKLAGDADVWVRNAVHDAKDQLQLALSKDDLLRLTDDESPKVRELAQRMLDDRSRAE